MAEDLGTIKLEISSDEREIQRAHRKAGEEQGRAFREASGTGGGAGGGGAGGRPIVTESGVEQAVQFGAGTGLSTAGGRIGGAQGLALKAGGFGFGGFESLAAGGLINFASTGSRSALTGAAVTGGTGAALAGIGAAAGAAAGVILPFVALGAVTKKTIDALQNWDQQLQQATQQLAPFSGAILGTQLQSMMGELGRRQQLAQTLGPTLARTEQMREQSRQFLFPFQEAGMAFRAVSVEMFQGLIRGIQEGILDITGAESAAELRDDFLNLLIGGTTTVSLTGNPILMTLNAILRQTKRIVSQDQPSSTANSIYEKDLNAISMNRTNNP